MPRDAFFLFAYGSLRSVESAPAARELLTDCDRVTDGTVAGIMYDMGDFPALVLGGPDRVRGVIWRCPAARLPALDEYEGTASGLFRRIAVQVGPYACWVYVAGPKLGPRLLPEARITAEDWTT